MKDGIYLGECSYLNQFNKAFFSICANSNMPQIQPHLIETVVDFASHQEMQLLFAHQTKVRVELGKLIFSLPFYLRRQLQYIIERY